MTLEQKKMQEAAIASTPDDASSKSPGHWLKHAREEAGLTVQQIADGLRLDLRLILAIEENHFKDLGAPVYAKGYIRKYARMVNLAEESVLQRYEAWGDVAVLSDPIPSAKGTIPQPPRSLPGWALWVVLALIVIAVAITLLQLRSGDSITGGVSTTVDRALQTTIVDSSAAVGPAGSPTSPIVVKPALGDAASAVAQAAGAADSGPPISLQLDFVGGGSWVEVYDAANRAVLYDLGRGASERQVSGTPPLRVVFGSASNINVRINGSQVSVPANRIEANVAHFSINASGAIE